MLFWFLLVIGLAVATYFIYCMFWDTYAMADTIIGKVIGTLFFWPLISGLVTSLLGGFAMVTIAVPVEEERVFSHSTDLQQINMGSNVEGSFFLGSGYVDEEQVYSYYYKSDGGFRVGEVYADEALIIETDGNPRIETYDLMLPEWFGPEWFREWDTEYTIHVPPGSVKPMVNMDLPE